MNIYYDKKNRPLEILEWAKLIEDRDYTKVLKVRIGKYSFSTIWLGLDHRMFELEQKPLFFESMAFKEAVGATIRNDLYQCRYTSINRARLGHFKMIAIVLYREFILFLKELFKG